MQRLTFLSLPLPFPGPVDGAASLDLTFGAVLGLSSGSVLHWWVLSHDPTQPYPLCRLARVGLLLSTISINYLVYLVVTRGPLVSKLTEDFDDE